MQVVEFHYGMILFHYIKIETINAIEDFNSEEIVVEQGNDKKTVVVNGKIKPINAMEKLYMTIVVQ